MAMNQSDALDAIQEILSGQRWTVEDLESIAEVMRKAGYDINDVDESEDECPDCGGDGAVETSYPCGGCTEPCPRCSGTGKIPTEDGRTEP